MNPTSDHRRPLIRLLFLATAILLIVQWLVAEHVAEPYPAVLMPRFGGDGGYDDGKVRVRALDIRLITDTGEELAPTSRELLSEFPESAHGLIRGEFLSPPEDGTTLRVRPSPPRGMRHRLFPSLRAGTHDRYTEENIASFQAWVASRAQALYPGRTVRTAEFRWSTCTYTTSPTFALSERVPAGSLVVPLRERGAE